MLRPTLRLHLRRQALGDATVVEHRGPFGGNTLHCGRQLRLHEAIAGAQRLTARHRGCKCRAAAVALHLPYWQPSAACLPCHFRSQCRLCCIFIKGRFKLRLFWNDQRHSSKQRYLLQTAHRFFEQMATNGTGNSKTEKVAKKSGKQQPHDLRSSTSVCALYCC